MAENSTETDLKTFKDFLTQYNAVAEQCFTSCITDFTTRNDGKKSEKSENIKLTYTSMYDDNK
uniref:Mitochondrial import inner membrane translocase subunit n=1 Tax=Wuchereria bancrofti TaxID=6293 RepID=A0AAF5Q6I3_WUCBA